MHEQQAIVAYLDEQCNYVDKLIAIFKNEILLLNEYRTCFVSGVVTGKVNIQEKEVPNYIHITQKKDLLMNNHIEK